MNISQNYSFYSIFNQINAAMVSIRDFYFSCFKKRNPNYSKRLTSSVNEEGLKNKRAC